MAALKLMRLLFICVLMPTSTVSAICSSNVSFTPATPATATPDWLKPPLRKPRLTSPYSVILSVGRQRTVTFGCIASQVSLRIWPVTRSPASAAGMKPGGVSVVCSRVSSS